MTQGQQPPEIRRLDPKCLPAPHQVREAYGIRKPGAVILIREIDDRVASIFPMSLGSEMATSEDLVLPKRILPGGEWTIHTSLPLNIDISFLHDALWEIEKYVKAPILFTESGGRLGNLGACGLGKAARNIGGPAYNFQLEVLTSARRAEEAIIVNPQKK